jgi:uncharacterized phage-associated protein
MPNHNVLAVANEFIERASNECRALTPMQLQKLCYFAHGYNLALFGQALTKDEIEAWDWGPVYPDLYDALKKFGAGSIPGPIHQNNWASLDHIKGGVVREKMTDVETALIDRVWDVYGHMEAFKLSAITHEDGSAWQRVYKPGKKHIKIPNELIKEQFVELTDA